MENNKGHGKVIKNKHNVIDFMVVSLNMWDRRCNCFSARVTL